MTFVPFSRRKLLASGLASGLALAALPEAARAAPAPFQVRWPCSGAEREQIRSALRIPGLGFAREGYGERSLGVSGLRMRGRSAAVQADDRWHWGSITKSMTATLIGGAVEAGLLTWDSRPLDVLRDALADAHPGYAEVTLLHLLTHRAGIVGMDSDTELLTFPREEADPRASRLAAARLTLARAPLAPPGIRHVYGNRGYIIAAAMLEQVAGAPWEALMVERLFTPLGLTSAGFGAPGTPGLLVQPVGHASWDGPSVTPHPPGLTISDNPAVMGPAARVHMNLADMLIFLAAHRDAAPLLTRATWQRLHRAPYGGNYAPGWMVAPEGLWHSGSNRLWNAEVIVTPGNVAAAACNDGDFAKVNPAFHAAIRDGERYCGV
jgi:CubicO group peptidase (beta-lactamase class C family)